MTSLFPCFLMLIFLNEPALSLKITLHNLKPERGVVNLAIYESDSSFLKDDGVVYYAVEKVDRADSLVIHLRVSSGVYAISTYQDVNEDKHLNKNFIGIPSEPYGFSNDAMGLMGPPSFREAAIHVVDHMNVQIHLR